MRIGSVLWNLQLIRTDENNRLNSCYTEKQHVQAQSMSLELSALSNHWTADRRHVKHVGYMVGTTLKVSLKYVSAILLLVRMTAKSQFANYVLRFLPIAFSPLCCVIGLHRFHVLQFHALLFRLFGLSFSRLDFSRPEFSAPQNGSWIPHLFLGLLLTIFFYKEHKNLTCELPRPMDTATIAYCKSPFTPRTETVMQ